MTGTNGTSVRARLKTPAPDQFQPELHSKCTDETRKNIPHKSCEALSVIDMDTLSLLNALVQQVNQLIDIANR